MSATLQLALDLVDRPSVTPDDAGCQVILIARLKTLGFRVERLRFGDVDNFWARWGESDPVFAFAGHTDVVPPGPLEQWRSPPFAPQVRDGLLYGRGAADMKGSLAAMITACEGFLAECPQPRGSIAFLITSDEEGAATDGTVKIVERLEARGEKLRWCLVGEPSCSAQLGDTLKNGRRGSLNGRLALHGVQGHVAYPYRAQNPIHAIGPLLTALTDEIWDRGDAFFPPTSLQISNLNAGTGADNVIPGRLEMLFNFRFSPAVTVEQLQERARLLIETALLNQEIKTGEVFQYDLEWRLSGPPFFTPPGDLVTALSAAIRAETGLEPALSTGGGTSDGRFIAPTGAQVVEFGPLNATIHKINECVAVADLERLRRIYQDVLKRLLGEQSPSILAR
ncbi:MAG: succinyl-diaminopimelate desuccinylase [Candidatus Contendobacter sp.]